MTHVGQLKKALGIGSVATTILSWLAKPKSSGEQGAQIDLVIDRADGCINLCEMKFTSTPFVLIKSYAAILENKRQAFLAATRTTKGIFVTFVTTYGVIPGEHSSRAIDEALSMEVLFE